MILVVDTPVSTTIVHLPPITKGTTTTMSDAPIDTDKRHVEVSGREFPTFTVTSVDAPGIEFRRFLHDDGRYHTSASFHDATGLQIKESIIKTDEGSYPTTTLSFKVKGENVTVTLFGVKA